MISRRCTIISGGSGTTFRRRAISPSLTGRGTDALWWNGSRGFKERQENPAKQWKITDEDWRNREKWDEYETAVNEMLVRTSTTYAPWVVVEGNSKYYARVKVLRTVVDALEERVKQCGRK